MSHVRRKEHDQQDIRCSFYPVKKVLKISHKFMDYCFTSRSLHSMHLRQNIVPNSYNFLVC